MNEHLPNTEALIQYLDGELNEAESAAIAKQIADDSRLADELERLRLSKAAMATYGLKRKIGSIHQEMMKELQEQPTEAPVVRLTRLLKYGWRIAAVILLLVGSATVFQYLTTSSQKLFGSRFEAYQLNEMRGTESSGPLDVDYQKGSMEELRTAFKQLTQPSVKDYFLYGNASLQLHDAPAAIAAFQAAQNMNTLHQTHFFEDDIAYFLALAYLKNNQPALSLPLFEAIYQDPSHPYHKKTGAWFMERLKKIAR